MAFGSDFPRQYIYVDDAVDSLLAALDAASLIDWATTCVVAGVGLLLDKGLPPFEHQIGPQLSDPRIAYPHTPGAETHCPKPLLVALAFLLRDELASLMSGRKAGSSRSHRRGRVGTSAVLLGSWDVRLPAS